MSHLEIVHSPTPDPLPLQPVSDYAPIAIKHDCTHVSTLILPKNVRAFYKEGVRLWRFRVKKSF